MSAIRRAAAAVAFLTRIPVSGGPPVAGQLRGALPWFPAVGLVVAVAGVAVRAASGPLVGPATGAVLAVAAMVALTGALHEDALADAADGLWGATTAHRRIEIMRDSRIGTYGAAALTLSLLTQVSLLAPLGLGDFARACVVGHVLGRAAGVLVAVRGVAAPSSGSAGLGAAVLGPIGMRAAVGAAALPVAAAAAVAGPWLWCPIAVAAVVAEAVRRLATTRLGGVTGDIIGAAVQLAGVASMAAVVALDRAAP